MQYLKGSKPDIIIDIIILKCDFISFLVKIMVMLHLEGADFPVSQFSSVHAHGCVN